MANKSEFAGNEDAWKKYLEQQETRIVTAINPFCNDVHKRDKPTTTRFPKPKATVDTDTQEPTEEPEQ